MRYAAGRKEETRARIVDAASRGFREHGLDRLGVAAIMSELGLTHGGFYAHFPDKDALVCAACERAFADAWAGADRQPPRPPREAVRGVARAYLSPAHRTGRACGCLLAALGPELSRGSPAVRRVVARIVGDRLSTLSARMPGRTARSRRDAATLLVSTLVGTMIVSRLLPEREGRRSLLVTRRVVDRVIAASTSRPSRRIRS
jgi:TetR/AcrR family transcriptional regulator, transcriptional repressor for nem operon